MGNCVNRLGFIREKDIQAYKHQKVFKTEENPEIFENFQSKEQDFSVTERNFNSKFDEICEYLDDVICSDG